MGTEKILICSRRQLIKVTQRLAEEASDHADIEFDVGKPYDDDIDDDYLESVLALLESKHVVKGLRICCDFFSSEHVSATKINRLCDVMAGLHAITFEFGANSNVLHHWNNIIQKATGLIKLCFYCPTFDGSTQDFQELCSTLSSWVLSKKDGRGMICLELVRCKIAKGKDRLENVNPFLNVLNVLCSLPKKKARYYFDLNDWIPKGWNGSEPSEGLLLPLGQFLGKLDELTISNSSRLPILSSAIQYHKTSPKSLCLENLSLNKEELQDVARIVSNSKSSLKKLHLRTVEAGGSPHEDDDYAPLVQALGENTTLQSFTLDFRRTRDTIPFGQDLLESFADVVETQNWNLTKLEFRHIHPWTWPSMPLSLPPPIGQRIKYNTKLNWLGRSKVLQKDPQLLTREDWIWRLHRSRNDISCLYFFLSMNPFLCDGCGETTVVLEDEGGIANRTRKRRKVSSTEN